MLRRIPKYIGNEHDIESSVFFFFFGFYVMNLLDRKIDVIEFVMVVPKKYTDPPLVHNLIKKLNEKRNVTNVACIFVREARTYNLYAYE